MKIVDTDNLVVVSHDDIMKIQTGKQIREFRNKLHSDFKSAEKFGHAIGYSGRQILDVESKKNRNKKITSELSEAIEDFQKRLKAGQV